MQKLKVIIQQLNKGKIIDSKNCKEIIEHQKKDIILRLLAIIHNAFIRDFQSQINDNRRKCLVILQQLVPIFGELTSLSEPLKMLAIGQKYEFFLQCKENSNLSCLNNKVLGLFPRINIEYHVPFLMRFEQLLCDEGLMIGNPKWMLTRQIVNKWYNKQKNNMQLDVDIGCCILLSKVQILDIKQWTFWQKIWIYLYLWLNKQFLDTYYNQQKHKVKPSWCNFNKQQFKQNIFQLKSNLNNHEKEDNVIFNLLFFILIQYIFKTDSDQNNYFRSAVQNYIAIFQNKQYSWHDFLILKFFKKYLDKLGHNQTSDMIDRVISNAISLASKNESQAPEFKYLLPYLMRDEQAIQFMLSNRHDFWNYEFDENMNVRLAKDYMKIINKFVEDDQFNIIINLDNKNLIKLIEQIQFKDNKQNQKILIKIILKYNYKFTEKLYKQFNIEKYIFEKNLKILMQIYNAYLIHQKKIERQLYKNANKLLLFDNENLSEQFKIRLNFDKKFEEIFIKILYNFTKICQQDQLFNNQYFLIIFLNPYFLRNYDNLIEDYIKEQLSQRWQNILIKNTIFLQNLMQIKPVNEMQQKQQEYDHDQQ